MSVIHKLGYRTRLSCDDIVRRSARQEFWRRERRYHRNRWNATKRTLFFAFLFFFLLGAWMNGEWLYYRRLALWGVLIGSLLQIPVIGYIFRERHR